MYQYNMCGWFRQEQIIPNNPKQRQNNLALLTFIQMTAV